MDKRTSAILLHMGGLAARAAVEEAGYSNPRKEVLKLEQDDDGAYTNANTAAIADVIHAALGGHSTSEEPITDPTAWAMAILRSQAENGSGIASVNAAKAYVAIVKEGQGAAADMVDGMICPHCRLMYSVERSIASITLGHNNEVRKLLNLPLKEETLEERLESQNDDGRFWYDIGAHDGPSFNEAAKITYRQRKAQKRCGKKPKQGDDDEN